MAKLEALQKEQERLQQERMNKGKKIRLRNILFFLNK